MSAETVNLGAQSGTVAPGDLVICGDTYAHVRRVVVHPPTAGKHPGPIVPAMHAVEVQTESGTRWLGGNVAYIGSDLRVHWDREVSV